MSISGNSNIAAPIPTLKDYVFGGQLGRGTYGIVYKCCKKGSSGRDLVAIKCIYKKGISSRACDNLITEISILKQVKHEFIVNLLDFQWDSNYIYLIFEYCSEGDLSVFIKARKNKLKSWKLSEEVIRYFLQQLASALQHLNKLHISHFDLKPSNIMLSRRNTFGNLCLKLGDFGFAKALSSEREKNSDLRGTPLYMAPEILIHNNYDSRADLWSVGVILYEIIFGRPPFKSSSFKELCRDIQSTQYVIRIPSSVHISYSCHDLLVQLLQRNPSERISFESFFKHPFLDLKHIPCFQTYNEGCKLISKAVAHDQAGKHGEAIDAYLEALQFLIPIVKWGLPLTNETEKLNLTKEGLRIKVTGYLERVEVLKSRTNDLSSREEMALFDAQENCHEAEFLTEAGCLSQALSKYQNSLQVILPLVKKMKGEQKETYLKLADKWLSKAEELKKIIQASKSENVDQQQQSSSGERWISLKRRKQRPTNVSRPVILREDDFKSADCHIQ